MITVSQELQTNGLSGILAKGTAISYTTKTDQDGDVVMDESITEAISRLDQAVKDGPDVSDIKSDVDEIKSKIDNIDTKVTQASNSASLAKDYSDLAKGYKESLGSMKDDIDTIKEAAVTFNTAFDADASFAIVSEADYASAQSSGNLKSNCIYFCFK